jgi:hypothetical protein
MRTPLIIIIIVSLFSSCTQDKKIEIARKNWVDNVYDSLLIPNHNSFYNSILMDDHIDILLEKWQALTYYNIHEVANNFKFNQIAKWPVDTNLINELYTSGDFSNFNKIGSSTKGLYAISYVYYSSKFDSNITLKTELIDAYRTNLISKYEDIDIIFSNMKADLTYDKSVSSTFSELINQIISKVEQIKKSKLGKPLGKGNYGYIDLTKVEAPYSKISLDLLLADLIHLNDLILSMKSMLDEQSLFVNSSLMSDTILNKIDTIKKLINSSSDPSLQNFINDHYIDANRLYDLCLELLFLIKIDLANACEVTVTFSDNDGD